MKYSPPTFSYALPLHIALAIANKACINKNRLLEDPFYTTSKTNISTKTTFLSKTPGCKQSVVS